MSEMLSRCNFISQQNDSLIMAHYESENKATYPLEQVVKSLNHLIFSIVIQEYTFCQNFFCLNDEESIIYFALIFRQSILSALDQLNRWVSQSQHIFTLLLTMEEIQLSKQQLAEKKFNGLEYYTTQLEAAVNPIIDKSFKSLISDFANSYNKLNKKKMDVQSACELPLNLMSFIEIFGLFASTCKISGHNYIGYVKELIIAFDQFVKRLLEEYEENLNTSVSVIKLYHMLVKSINKAAVFSPNFIYDYDTKLSAMIEDFCKVSSATEFVEVINLTKKLEKEKAESQEIDQLNIEFEKTVISKLEALKKDLSLKFENTGLLSKIYKLLVQSILEHLSSYQILVKAKFPAHLAKVYPAEKLLSAAKNIFQ